MIPADLRNKEMSGVDEFGVEAGNDDFFKLDTVMMNAGRSDVLLLLVLLFLLDQQFPLLFPSERSVRVLLSRASMRNRWHS